MTVDACPLASVRTLDGLMVAIALDREKVTMAFGTAAPVASLTSGVTVPGADALITLELRLRTTEPAVLAATPVVPVPVVLVPVPVPDPLPKGVVPESPPPPPHATNAAAAPVTNIHFTIFIRIRSIS